MPELALTMPKMSMTMEEGTVVTWLKQPGDAVRNGEPVAEVTTDKVDMEVESPYDGVLARIVAEPDDVVAVGEPIAYIESESADLLGGLFDVPELGMESAGATEIADAGTPPASSADTASTSARISNSDASGWPAAVPAARALATSEGVDLAAVHATGRWGAATVRDVDQAVRARDAGPAAATPPPDSSPASPALERPKAPSDPVAARRIRTRMTVARAMEQSALVPQFTAWIDLDLARLDAVRKSNLGGASWTVILMRAFARALAENSPINQAWTPNGPVVNQRVGIALAIDSPSGLIAPVFVNPHRGSLEQLGASVRETVEATRAGTLSADRLQGGTSVLSNLGGFGVDRFNALLTPPHASALSTGSIAKRIVVNEDGSFGPRLQCTIGLTLDHRVADGADAARALQRIREIAADPALLA